MGAAEITENIFLHIASLLLTDYYATMTSDPTDAGWHCLVVTKESVAV
jgi:hypothetical protein